MDQARSHLSPKGGQSPAVFAGDWPPLGALACGNTNAEGEVGYAGRVRRVLRMVWRRVLRRVWRTRRGARVRAGEVVLTVGGAGLRSLPAQQQAPKALPYGRQFSRAWRWRDAGIVRADRARVTIRS